MVKKTSQHSKNASSKVGYATYYPSLKWSIEIIVLVIDFLSCCKHELLREWTVEKFKVKLWKVKNPKN
jgi:hypothetical protein